MAADLRRAFTLVELLVVVFIVAVLVGLMLPAVRLLQEAADRTSCRNNLGAIGHGLHQFHNAHGFFPNNQGRLLTPTVPPGAPAYTGVHYPAISNCFVDILPFIEHDELHSRTIESGGDDETAVPIFLCPTQVDLHKAGARVSYASGIHPHAYSDPSSSALTVWQWGFSSWSSVFAVMAGVYPQGSLVTLDKVTGADGSSNTLLLAHQSSKSKWLLHSTAVNNQFHTYFSTARAPNYFKANDIDQGGGSNFCTPHGDIMPCLWADNSVRPIKCGNSFPDEQLGFLWGWNDGRRMGAVDLDSP